MEWIFVGDVLLDDGIVPIYVAVGKTSVLYGEFKEYLKYLNSLESYFVHDGSYFYHRVYKNTVRVGARQAVIGVEELLRESEKVNTTLCDFLRAVPVVSYARGSDTYRFLPVIVKYTNYWEHLSTAPIKIVKDSQTYYIYKKTLGIIVVDNDAPVYRPYAKSIMEKPTSVILGAECGLRLEESKPDRREVDNLLLQ